MLPQVVQHIDIVQLPWVVNKTLICCAMYNVRYRFIPASQYRVAKVAQARILPNLKICRNFCIVELGGLKQKPAPKGKPESLQTSLTMSQSFCLVCNKCLMCNIWSLMFIVQCRVRSMPLQVRSLPHLGLALPLRDRTLLASDAIRQINQHPHIQYHHCHHCHHQVRSFWKLSSRIEMKYNKIHGELWLKTHQSF